VNGASPSNVEPCAVEAPTPPVVEALAPPIEAMVATLAYVPMEPMSPAPAPPCF